MQKDMSLSTFGGAIQIHVSVLNGISNLNVVPYLHDWHEGSTDVSHFFSRTLTLTNKNSDILLRPWMEIELGVSLIELEWDGKSFLVTDTCLFQLLRDGRSIPHATTS